MAIVMEVWVKNPGIEVFCVLFSKYFLAQCVEKSVFHMEVRCYEIEK
jgi:hypothetical protein